MPRGAFIAELREREAVAARALEFTILTASRTGEVIGARWNEFDLVKGEREHRVPLSPAAIAVLETVELVRDADDAFVFPCGRRDQLSKSHGSR
jgi:integrase